jgi:hypothetical protein
MKETFHFPSFSSAASSLLMAEPTTQADQHAHVEAENRLHNVRVLVI